MNPEIGVNRFSDDDSEEEKEFNNQNPCEIQVSFYTFLYLFCNY